MLSDRNPSDMNLFFRDEGTAVASSLSREVESRVDGQ